LIGETKIANKTTYKIKCGWCVGDPVLERYHDYEWGKPIKDDNRLFERMTLEIFQAGLSWKIILYKRDALRKAFDNFDIRKVAGYNGADIKRLLKDESIIRNRLKINSTVSNARSILKIQNDFGSFSKFLKNLDPLDKELVKIMKTQFTFMGPEIIRCFFMGIGKIPVKHEKNCWKYKGT
jgi:DNA-3-methyladenine glycosylase I